MADFINREEFAVHLADIQYGEAPTGRTGQNIDYQNGVYAGLDMAYVALNRFPAADVRSVKIGHYVSNGMGDSSCSECGEKYLDITKRFCPNCGANMREIKKDD